MNIDEMRIREMDLFENPSPRVPVAVCLDVSYSMDGDPIAELNRGVGHLYDSLRQDPIARCSAEVAVVGFADRPGVVADFQNLDRVAAVPKLRTGSDLGYSTDLGGGVLKSLELLEGRKAEYRNAGVDYFQPFLVIMTDGQPNSDAHPRAARRCVELESSNKLVVMPIGIGPQADMGVLATFSRKRPPLRLKGLNFAQFFEWLSRSVARTSQSMPGEKIQFDTDGIKGWAEVG